MEIKTCKQCGHQVTENSSFSWFNKKPCPNCGANDFIISPAPHNYGRVERSPVTPKIKVILKIVILFFAFLGVIFFAMFTYYFLEAFGLF